jgi:hypothetical protein
MELAAGGGLYRAKWTADIHDEWIRNLLESRPDLKREQIERTRDLMNSAVPDCLVEGYQELIPYLQLPDENDRHVLAAAIQLELIHPDDFIFHQFGIDDASVLVSVQNAESG